MNTDTLAVYKTDQRYPPDLCHNGHGYELGYRKESKQVQRALRKLRTVLLRRHSVDGRQGKA